MAERVVDFIDSLEVSSALHHHNEPIDILQEGLMLKFNIQNLKRDFQQIIEGVDQLEDTKYTMSAKKNVPSMSTAYGLLENPHYCTPTMKKPRKEAVLVDSDFNSDRVPSDPRGLIVSDRPRGQLEGAESEKQQEIRSVYRIHKKRLMARRESGDGAPADKLPNRQHFRSRSQITSMSPVRRLPVKKLTVEGSPIVNRPYSRPTEPRLSPEGLDCDVVSKVITPTRTFRKSLPVLETDNVKSDVMFTPKKSSAQRRMKKHFPKTPKSGKQLHQDLETIGEDQLVEVRKIRKQLENVGCNKELYQFHASESQNKMDNKASSSNLKDISQISNFSKTSFREQPSNMNCLEQYSFGYPLHSTISYPLHSTLQNALLNITDDGDLSSIVCKDQAPLDVSNSRSSSGVSSSDSEKQVAAKSVSAFAKKSSSKFASVSAAEGVNMDKFSCDEGIMSDSSDDSFFGIKVPSVQKAVQNYYKLNPKVVTEEEESDCDSSVLSVNVDDVVQPVECKDVNIITCRCHVHQVHKIRRNLQTPNLKRDFVESALFLEPQHTSHRSSQTAQISGRRCNASKTSRNHVSGTCCSVNHMDSDRMCHSIESMTSIHPLISEDVCVKTSRSNIVTVKPAPTNCMNIGKMLQTMDNSSNDKTLINESLMDATLVTKGCMGFLKKKSSSKSKKSIRKLYDEEDKENMPVAKPTTTQKSASTVYTENSIASSSMMDRQTKKRLSKRMKDFRETTFSDPRRMVYQTMGHL